MKVLVLNCGSSSIKYQVFAMPKGEIIAKGLVQRIGEPEGTIEQSAGGSKQRLTLEIPDHEVGLQLAVKLLTEGGEAPLGDVSEVEAVGHRVVHGGERFTETVRIDDEVIQAIEAHSEHAPLHNPPNLQGIRVALKMFPGAPQVAVFDTAFHQTMPPHSYRYALPEHLYREGGIRRYGFHGTSYRYVAMRAAAMLGVSPSDASFIICHLGNGCSIAAIAKGKSVDTSMGLTPLEGLVMGTRSGDIDPGILFHLGRVQKLSMDEINKLLNKQSGLLGISGKSNDVRELLELVKDGDEKADLALDVFCYRLKKYIGAYYAVLGKVDALVFTAGIGENSPEVRSRACAGLECLGIGLDEARNKNAVGRESDVTAKGMSTRVLVVPTNEEKLIAMDTYQLATGKE
ncbi:MAG: acetate kinase [Candidatus Latescibacterota bacterium]